MSKQSYTDVLVIGSGAAGMTIALKLAQQFSVSLISKNRLTEGSSLYAQGGIAAVLDKADSFDSHIQDTLNAGAGLCDEKAVNFTIKKGPEAVRWLIDQGVSFTFQTPQKRPDDYHLTKEGGHSHRRVIHAADATGVAIESTLDHQVRQHNNITVYEQHLAIDLITTEVLGIKPKRCAGAYVFDKTKHHVEVFRSRFVILATGGASKVYLYTSNPDCSTGDGIAMAWRAGCRVANMEFNQFHPTCLYHPQAKSALITEAIRGEGGKLLLPDGSRFMHQFDS